MFQFLIAVCVLTVALLSHAQAVEYTFTTLDLPCPNAAPSCTLTLLKVTNPPIALLGDASVPGGIGARIPPDLSVEPIVCPDQPPPPTATRGGPQVFAFNNAQYTVGQGELPEGLYAFAQRLDGPCEFFLPQDAVGALASGISDTETIIGQYWTDEFDLGLLRFHGFEKNGDIVTPLIGLEPNDVIFPTATNAVGDMVGYYLRVDADNSYVYQAFLRRGGVYEDIDYPDGSDLWFTHINNVGQALAVIGPADTIGGPVVLYDIATGTFTPLPQPPGASVFVARGLNDEGAYTGTYIVSGGGELPQTETHHFLATPVLESPPVVEVPTPEPEPEPPVVDRPKHRHHKHRYFAVHRRIHTLLARLRELRAERSGLKALRVPLCYEPVEEEDGSISLVNGTETIGR